MQASENVYQFQSSRLEQSIHADFLLSGYRFPNIMLYTRETAVSLGTSKKALKMLSTIITSRLTSRDVLSPLTRSLFHGHETTQLLNNYKNYDDEIYTVT